MYVFIRKKCGENEMKNLFQYIVLAVNFNFTISERG